jgi:hypothetical protein
MNLSGTAIFLLTVPNYTNYTENERDAGKKRQVMANLLYHSASQLYHPQSRGFTGFWYSGTVGTPENAFFTL